MDDINNILRDLSIGKNYKGHREIAYAIQLLLEDEDRLCAVVKEVYIPVAKHFAIFGEIEKSPVIIRSSAIYCSDLMTIVS